MTEITRKTSYKDAKAVYENESNPPELRAKAKERMDEIKAWLDSKKEKGESPKTSYEPDTLDISQIPLDDKQKAEIFETAEDGANRMLVVLRAVQECCRKAGVTHPATVGMIFNQVCENRR